MNKFSRRVPIMLLAITAGFCGLACNQTLANGDNNAAEFAKYLNPFQKRGNLNQSQDRIIKKKAFKADIMPETTAQPAVNSEIGFFAIIPPGKSGDSEFVSQALADKRVNGISVVLPWSLLQPKEDEENWQPIDQLLSACQGQGKTLILRISTAGIDLPDSASSRDTGKGKEPLNADTPKWVFDSGVKSVTFQSPDGQEHIMPIFWNKDFLAKWSNFITDLAARYDNNSNIHSIGITGGGFTGGTAVLPDYPAKVADAKESGGYIDLEKALKSAYGMTQRQLAEHWKYAADVFPKRFHNARLNFAINPPVPHRYGEDALDEISDYLVYRYGERVYLTRQNTHNGKHGFDDYRLLLKFRNDTLTGLMFTDDVAPEDMPKIVKHALDDGISFAELPASVLNSDDQAVKTALNDLFAHIGFQLVDQKALIEEKIAAGQPLKANFTFVNIGAATAMRPERNFDKDTPESYRVAIELHNAQGKPVLQNVHTPPTPTNRWLPGKPVSWEEDLKMVDSDKHQLPPGEYTAWMSLVDASTKRKINFINATSTNAPTSANIIEVGKVVIMSEPPASKKLEANSETGDSPDRHQ